MTQGATGWVTHLTDAVEARPEQSDGLRVGHRLLLRRRGEGATVEAWSDRHGRVGRLPPEAGVAVAPLLHGRPGPLTATVSALVPRPGVAGGTRIHIRLGAAE
jgi:hypothetical protein